MSQIPIRVNRVVRMVFCFFLDLRQGLMSMKGEGRAVLQQHYASLAKPI